MIARFIIVNCGVVYHGNATLPHSISYVYCYE